MTYPAEQYQAEQWKQQLEEIQTELDAAKPHIAKAIDLIHVMNLARGYSEIYSDVADAHFYCSEALDKLIEQLG